VAIESGAAVVAKRPRHYHLESDERTRIPEWPIGMSVAADIERKLTAALQPQRVKVIDESELHKGHAGHRPGGESHFRVEIVSTAFEGQSRVARQRRVYEILADELKAGVHALALKTLTPAEDSPPRQVPV
jgi:BolA family transcriptional regulator, general stress-responsive regulator